MTKFTNKGGNPKEEDGMSCITNEPRHKNGVLQAIREQPEHRAMWLYLLCDEAAEKETHLGGFRRNGDPLHKRPRSRG